MTRILSEVAQRPSLRLLLLVNVLPLVGVIWFGWTLFSVLFLYWLESAIIGFFNVFKLARLAGWGSLALVPFFIVHYGMFMSVHLIFLVVLFGGPQPFQKGPVDVQPLEVLARAFHEVAVPFAALFISHGYSYLHNFLGQREFERLDAQRQMGSPYGRIIIMHLTIIFGAFLIAIFRTPMMGLVLLVALKTAADAHAHLREHAGATAVSEAA